MEKALVILRGLPGAGKTSTAKLLATSIKEDKSYPLFAADDFFYDKDGNYNFDHTKLGVAHKVCFDKTEKALQAFEDKVFVHNTFVREREISSYEKLAKKYNYRFVSLIVENRHGHISVHGVPDDTMKKMLENFSIKLNK